MGYTCMYITIKKVGVCEVCMYVEMVMCGVGVRWSECVCVHSLFACSVCVECAY